MDCTKDEIKELKENKVALQKYLKESGSTNELLGHKLAQKELKISNLKIETVCKNKRITKMCMDAYTHDKLKNSSTILDEILSYSRYP